MAAHTITELSIFPSHREIPLFKKSSCKLSFTAAALYDWFWTLNHGLDYSLCPWAYHRKGRGCCSFAKRFALILANIRVWSYEKVGDRNKLVHKAYFFLISLLPWGSKCKKLPSTISTKQHSCSMKLDFWHDHTNQSGRLKAKQLKITTTSSSKISNVWLQVEILHLPLNFPIAYRAEASVFGWWKADFGRRADFICSPLHMGFPIDRLDEKTFALGQGIHFQPDDNITAHNGADCNFNRIATMELSLAPIHFFALRKK